MFDCNHFLHRNGWRQRDLAERLGLGTSTGNDREEEVDRPITRAEAVEIFKELCRDK